MADMTEYFVVVPAPGAKYPIDAGSGIVMTDNGNESVIVDVEGNRDELPALNVYADRVFHALGHAQTNSQTSTRFIASRDDFIVVGHLDQIAGVVIVDNSNAASLTSWLGNYDTVDLNSTATRHVVARENAPVESSDGRSRRAERSRQVTRTRIVDESRRVLRSGTIFDLTVRSLADELGMSRVTIYQHFPTIRDILKTLTDETIALIFSNLPEVPATERSYLEKFVSLTLDVFTGDSQLIRNLVLATEMGNSVSGWFRGDLEELIKHVVGQLPTEMRPVSSDPAQSARIMVTYFRGALYGWAAGFIDDETFASEVRRAATLSVADT